MPRYVYLGKIFNSRKELKRETGLSSCKVDAKIKESQIIKLQGNSDETVHNNANKSE